MLEGTAFKLVQSARDSKGERVEFEITLPPGAPSPPPHFHPRQTEKWHVIEGTLSVLVDEDWRELRAGESVTIPPGHVHTLRNRSSGAVRVRDVHVPAGDFQEYIETLHRLFETGKVKSTRNLGSLVYLSMLLHEHRRSGGQVTAGRPQRAGETVLAAIGKLLNFKL
jgi:mannose-6-phosphate isomerase-like protein (cupin superfamily)